MRRAIVFLVLVLVCIIGAGERAGASDNPSWTNGVATISQNIPVVANVRGECTGIIQERYVVELGITAKICLFGTDQMRFGYFSSGGPYVGVVQFSLSENVHVIEGVCSGVKCVYSAETNTLVTQQSVIGGYQGVVVYSNATDRVRRVQTPGQPDRYMFDTTQPDYSVKNNEGQYIATPSFAISRNGKWIVVELRNAGIAVIDMDTFTAKQLVTDGYLYGYGMDPSMQLAVSDDGMKVAVTGQNAGFKVIERIGNCGQDLIGNLSKQTGSITCSSSDLAIGVRFPNFHSTELPRFFGDGYQLEVVVNSWVDGSRIVTFTSSGVKAAPKLKLLTFGDSFTSGEGEENESFYRSGTNEGFDRCHVSNRSYPMLLAQAVGYSSEEAKTVACAGATTGDIYGTAHSYWGQGDRLGMKGLGLTISGRNLAQESAVYEFQPGRALQTTFLERYRPEKLLIGIGGNDAGLMGKLRACVMPGTCEWVSDEGLRSTADEIKRLYSTLSSLFAHIAESSPETKVFVVGYPNIIDSNGVCDPVTNILLNQKERVFIERSIEYLNTVIRAASKQAEFAYLDIEKSMHGKRLCNDGQIGMNGLRLGDDISIDGSFPMLKIIGSETFHPTPLGHDLVAKTILAENPGLQPSPVCATDPMACIPSFVDIEPPSYWGTGGYDKVSSYAGTFATRSLDDEYSFSVFVPSGTFEPGSTAHVQIRSDPVVLDIVAIDQKGGYVGEVSIPKNTVHGFHTLHMLGSNRSGEPIDLYQAVTVGRLEARVVRGENEAAKDFTDTNNTFNFSSFSTNDGSGLHGMMPGFMEVLGEQLAVGPQIGSSVGNQNVSPPAQSINEDVGDRSAWMFVGTTIGMIAVVASVLFLIRRKWAKQST